MRGVDGNGFPIAHERQSICRALCGATSGTAMPGIGSMAENSLLDMKMAPIRGPFPYYIFLSIMGFFIMWWWW